MDSVVEAIYSEPLSKADKGNLFIEALPDPILDEDKLINYSTRNLIHFENRDDMSIIQKRLALNELRELRLFLPFQSELEFRFYESLVKSYRKRKLIVKEDKVNLVGNIADGANPGFSLLGYSGCGKSTAISMLLEKYPQVIIHKLNNGKTRFVQIVYLIVSVMPNSNFNALYTQIGSAIDRCLGTDCYEVIMNKRVGLGAKHNILCKWIEQFGIGTILFDEIQLMSFSSNQENNFDSIMTLNNMTKVAISVIGTEEAKYKIFSKLQTGRRVGSEINASQYCLEKQYFRYMMNQLFKYQWFDQKIELTKEIEDTFYEETKGIIDQTISLYTAVHDEHFRTGLPVTPAFISKVSSKYFSGLKKLLSNINNVESQNKINQIIKDSKLKRMEEINNIQQKEVIKKVVTNTDDVEKIKLTISSIQRCFDYPDDKIYSLCKSELLKDSTLTVDALTKKVVQQLTSTPGKLNDNQLNNLLGL